MVVDHEHNGGGVRGLLCGWCNTALGYLKDDPELAHRAIEYLRKGGVDDSPGQRLAHPIGGQVGTLHSD
jgi:hypothetical protein